MCILLFPAVQTNQFFQLAGHKVDFIAAGGENKYLFDPLAEKNRVQHWNSIVQLRKINIFYWGVKKWICLPGKGQ